MEINYTSTFKTVLKATVVISPEQINNNLYMNIKGNLESRLLGKGYKNYGIIDTIYNIQKISEGRIPQEDNNCDVYYDVEFSCRITKPTINNIIIAKIDTINSSLIVLTSGCMKIMVKTSNINNELFMTDSVSNLYKYKQTDKPFEAGDYFKVRVLSYTSIAKDTTIYIIGEIVDVATESDVKKYYDSVYQIEKQDIDSIDYTDINDVIE